MQITIHVGRPRRPSVVLFVAAIALGLPSVAVANHQFFDVLTDHPFHNQISAIAGAGITAGFPDGGFHPSDPVTRQSMAAFMERGFGRAGFAGHGNPVTTTFTVGAGSTVTAPVLVRQLTITVPGATNAFGPKQLVHVQGRAALFDTMNGSAGCPCEFRAYILDATSNASSPSQIQTFESASFEAFNYSFDVEGLFAAAPGSRTFQLWVNLDHRNDVTNSFTFDLAGSSSVSATTFPLGSL